METPANRDRPIVVSALEYERSALRRIGLQRVCDLQVCGPGVAGVERWALKLAANEKPDLTSRRTVILAGLAGALVPNVRPRSAYIIGRVIHHQNQMSALQEWVPTLSLAVSRPRHDVGRVSVTSCASTLTNQSARLAAHERTGAELVDLESVAFARLAAKSNWNWAIIRGVSDDLSLALPSSIDQWVDSRGRVRYAEVARAVFKQPLVWRTCARLHHNGRTAMRAVANMLHDHLAQWG